MICNTTVDIESYEKTLAKLRTNFTIEDEMVDKSLITGIRFGKDMLVQHMNDEIVGTLHFPMADDENIEVVVGEGCGTHTLARQIKQEP